MYVYVQEMGHILIKYRTFTYARIVLFEFIYKSGGSGGGWNPLFLDIFSYWTIKQKSNYIHDEHWYMNNLP